ncbi:MAG: hypothetical protein JST87_14650 [Bacteroidetes bacterium]|nr:hypothetical protein [Bacteroidota bacterium]
MKEKLLFFAVILSTNVYSQKVNCNIPFPNHTQYQQAVILPEVDRNLMDDSTRSFFKQWKETYIRYKKYGDEECAYVYSKGNTGRNKGNECVSEGIGYGLIIVALMADENNSAENQKLFNELFRFLKKHPGTRDKEGFMNRQHSVLMGYSVNNIKSGKEKTDKSSASDGDIDIAFALLLANAQWHSAGEINYLGEADRLINAIYSEDINRYTKAILTSNNNEDDDNIKTAIQQKYYDIRTSDFMPSELKAFGDISKGRSFNTVVDSCYNFFYEIQKICKKDIGLIPDFVQNVGYNIYQKGYRLIIPIKKYQETKNDGKYYYNACRVPWRIATDYIISGDIRAKNFVEPINSWISSTCKNDPGKINAGYNLDGTEILTEEGEKDTLMMSFVCPFAVSAMVDKKNQSWLNNLWDCIVKLPVASSNKNLEYGYFENTIKMLTMIIISGNYWSAKK